MKNLVEFIKESKEELTLDKFFKYIYGANYKSPQNIEMIWSDNESLQECFKDTDYFLAFLDEHADNKLLFDFKIVGHDEGNDVEHEVIVEVKGVKGIELKFYMTNVDIDKMLDKYHTDIVL